MGVTIHAGNDSSNQHTGAAILGTALMLSICGSRPNLGGVEIRSLAATANLK